MEIRACPGCGGGDYAVVGRTAREVGVTVGGVRFSHPDYQARECTACGLVYKSDVMEWDRLQELYDRGGSPAAGYPAADGGATGPVERAIVRVLQKLRKGSKVWDYECGDGRLLGPLVGTHDCYGCDDSREDAKKAAAKGIRIIGERYAVPEEFDALVLADVFEHWPRPTAKLGELLEFVKPGGLVVIATGNADAAAAARDVANFWYLRTPEHLAMLGRRYVDWVCKNWEMELVEWERRRAFDLPRVERMRQRVWDFAYRTFHDGRPAVWAPALRWVPVLGRARKLKYPYPFTCTRDHVVVVMRKG